MKQSAYASLLAVALLLLAAAPSQAWSRWHGHHFHGHRFVHSHVFFGFGPVWGPSYWYYPPPPYYMYSPPPVVYAPPPVVVQEQPPVYVEQPQSAPAAPAPSNAYWYYCPSAKGYYPSVPSCSEAWVKVPPR